MTLDEALALVRDGRLDEADAARDRFAGTARARLELAIAHCRGDAATARERAALLWHACEVDATVLAALVHHEHPELREPAADLLMRRASDAAYDTTAAWTRLAEAPGDLDAWRDVLANLIASGRDLEAVDGVARALAERVADFALWSLLATQLMAHRQRRGLVATVELGRRAFPHAPEMHATSALILLGLGDLEAAETTLAAIGAKAPDSPLVIGARAAVDEVRRARLR